MPQLLLTKSYQEGVYILIRVALRFYLILLSEHWVYFVTILHLQLYYFICLLDGFSLDLEDLFSLDASDLFQWAYFAYSALDCVLIVTRWITLLGEKRPHQSLSPLHLKLVTGCQILSYQVPEGSVLDKIFLYCYHYILVFLLFLFGLRLLPYAPSQMRLSCIDRSALRRLLIFSLLIRRMNLIRFYWNVYR